MSGAEHDEGGMDELVHAERLSSNYDERNAPVSMVVLHYTEMEGADAAIERLTDPEAKVSAHYIISEAGEVTRLVPEEKRAWHAGVSYWRGETDVNAVSVGIELDHPGHAYGYREFADAQIAALVPLLAGIVERYDIPRANVVGHSDVAPQRKTDPGELFPWARIAKLGLCLPRPTKLELGDPFDNDGAFYLALERFGYDISDGRKVVEAFQRRWRPELINGEIDGEIRAILFQLLLDRDRGLAR
ncbi:N-acetylmuramoyl-L-alanine amidase [Alteriqipengyuania lutimaris]|uniref:N-acetylmuramoyl-L-alanine amidase n=1 Tax=Alteriqipengyuania lutimaris TaxID=1538146 RepID=UPI0039AFE7B3